MKAAYCCCFGIHKVTSPALSDPRFSDDQVFRESMELVFDTRSNVTPKYGTNFVPIRLNYKLDGLEIDTIPTLLCSTNNTTPAYDVISRCAYVRAGSNNSGEYTFCMLIYLGWPQQPYKTEENLILLLLSLKRIGNARPGEED